MTAAASLASSSAYCACTFQAARPNTRARRQHRLAVTSQATHEVTDLPRTLLRDAGRLKREQLQQRLLPAGCTQQSPGSWVGPSRFRASGV